MLLDFYNLREQPFGETPDPKYLYSSPTHRETLASLLYGFESGRGFMTLIAKPGLGKTAVLFSLLERLQGSARTVFIFLTQYDSLTLLRQMLADLDIDVGTQDVVEMHRKLNELLVREAESGHRVVVVIDEAQNLSEPVLESVRLLSDFETPCAKLMQVILAGQPGLEHKLASPSLTQLRQRISIMTRLRPLTPAEANAYIDHRLAVAGYRGTGLFTYEARSLIYTFSEGVPRIINNLCFNALSLGFTTQKARIDGVTVREAAADIGLAPLSSEWGSSPYPFLVNPAGPSDPPPAMPGGQGRQAGPEVSAPGIRRVISALLERFGRRRWAFVAATLLTSLAVGTMWAWRSSIERGRVGRSPAGTKASPPPAVVAHPIGNAAGQLLVDNSSPAVAADVHEDKTDADVAVLPTLRAADQPAQPQLSSLVGDEAREQTANVETERIGATHTPRKLRALPQRQASRGHGQARSHDVSTALLKIDSVPPGARISIDGRPLGKTPVEATVSPGSHTYRAELAGYPSYENTVNTRPGVVQGYTIGLLRESSKAEDAKSAPPSTPQAASVNRVEEVRKTSPTTSASENVPSPARESAEQEVRGTSSTGSLLGKAFVPARRTEEEIRNTFLTTSLLGKALTPARLTAVGIRSVLPIPEPGAKPARPPARSPAQATTGEKSEAKVVEPPAPRAGAAAPEPGHLGGHFQLDTPISAPPPAYPLFAKQSHIQGVVKLQATIRKDGRVRNVKVISGNPLLAAAGRQAVSRWRYQPALLNGQPIEVIKEIELTFKLSN